MVSISCSLARNAPLRSFVGLLWVLCGPLWVLCGPLRSFVVLCGPLRSFAVFSHTDCPLFGGVRVSSMRATAAVKQTSDRVIASAKRRATGGNYPAHNRPYCRAVASLDSRESRNSFPGIDKKKIETRDSRVSLTSPEPTISCLPTV